MDTFALKVVLTPALIGAASLVGRRWGPAVSGWLVGLPLTSGPVAFFLALNQGQAFAADAAIGTLAGTISQAVFCLTYGWLAPCCGWPLTVLASVLGFAVTTAALHSMALGAVPLFFAVVLTLAVALRFMSGGRDAIGPDADGLPRWDIPARMVVATAFVVLLTGVAPALGPRLTGLLAPFPLYAAILAVFAHRLQGPASAASVLRGLLFGLFAFAGFFCTLGVLLQSVGIGPAFAAAVATALLFQAGSLHTLRTGLG